MHRTKELHDAIVIGAGQAGLATSWHLKRHGIEHVVLERGRIGEAWRSHRWDSFCLLLPNRVCQLPGFGYTGDDPDGFMPKADVIRFFDAYAASFNPPVREGVAVTELRRGLDGHWQILTADGTVLGSENAVVATGAHTSQAWRRTWIPGSRKCTPTTIATRSTARRRGRRSRRRFVRWPDRLRAGAVGPPGVPGAGSLSVASATIPRPQPDRLARGDRLQRSAGPVAARPGGSPRVPADAGCQRHWRGPDAVHAAR